MGVPRLANLQSLFPSSPAYAAWDTGTPSTHHIIPKFVLNKVHVKLNWHTDE